MNTRNFIVIFLMFIFTVSLSAVFDDYEPSPRARAMGGAFYSNSDDANGIFYNPAGLNKAGNNLMIGYTKIFSNDFQILNTVALSMELPKKFGTICIGLQSMDVDFQDVNLMSEKLYALAHSFTLLKDVHSEIDIGYTFNMYHLSINSFGDQPAFGINIGALAVLHQRTRIGFAVSNLNNPKVGEDSSHELPQKMAMGISYLPYTDVITSLELKKTLGGETEIHAGTEVKIINMLALRFGVRSQPTSYSMGAEFNLYNISINYAYNTHTIDVTHHFGVGYKF
ncbi:MAG: hypothetical protein KAU01_01530 [Candidatus Cloacimonetes bacterium]|nr:hypothetical protein [Candidatus Cloacimonadota bacterium]